MPERYTINWTAQWYQRAWPPKAHGGTVRKFLVHMTEGLDWPGYADDKGRKGAKAPNATGKPDFVHERLEVRQHFDWNASSRALRNELDDPGETNAVPGGVTQLEVVGTCSRETSAKWQRQGLRPGVDYLESWNLPAWVIEALAELWVDLHHAYGVPVELGSTHWVPYREHGTPTSAGKDAPQRLHGDAWVRARGLLGHEHADENEHGDPGDLDADAILQAALRRLNPPPPVPVTAHHLDPLEVLVYVRKPGSAGVSVVTPAGLLPLSKAQATRRGVDLRAYPAGDVYELDATAPVWRLPNLASHVVAPAAKPGR